MTSSFDPNIDHITSKDYKNIYQPNTDTFIFVDSLEKEQDFILKEIDPKVCFEIGFEEFKFHFQGQAVVI
jgi:release factor glutamine methyltransferase